MEKKILEIKEGETKIGVGYSTRVNPCPYFGIDSKNKEYCDSEITSFCPKSITNFLDCNIYNLSKKRENDLASLSEKTFEKKSFLQRIIDCGR